MEAGTAYLLFDQFYQRWLVEPLGNSSELIPILVVPCPVIDTSFVRFLRLREGRRVFQGGKDRFSHWLVSIGLRQTVGGTFDLPLPNLSRAHGRPGDRCYTPPLPADPRHQHRYNVHLRRFAKEDEGLTQQGDNRRED